MNMHGIFALAPEPIAEEQLSWPQQAIDWMKARRSFMFIVVLPSILVSGYYYLFASDQYVSEAHFSVRSANSASAPPSGLGSLLGVAGGAGAGNNDASSVADYLRSHDAVSQLQREAQLVERFRRPEADLISQLRAENPTPERLLKFYQGQVSVSADTDTGLTKLVVRTFRPEDSYAIISKLLLMGEKRVNDLNTRSYNDAIASSQRQLDSAERAVAEVQSRMTSFRQNNSDIDPEGSGKAQIGLVTTLRANLAAARSQLETMGAFIDRSSPQYVALARQVRSLSSRVALESAHLAGGNGLRSTIADNLGGFEDLRLRQEFVGKRYEAAAAALEQARERAQRQQLYLVRVVGANMPVKSIYPERGRIVLTVFIGLLLAYSIGWLIAAGVREHEA